MPKILLTNPDLDDHALFTAEFSADLKDFVLRGWIPHVEAKAIHRLPTESLQREAVKQFLSELTFQTVETRSSIKARLRSTSGYAYLVFVSLFVLVAAREIRYSDAMVGPSQPIRPQMTVEAIVPTTRLLIIRRHHPLPRPIFRAHCPNAPTGFTVRASPRGLRFSWKSVGPGYTYTLYRAEGPGLNALQKVKAHITSTSYTLRRDGSHDSQSWWVICGVNSYGGEGPLSGVAAYSR